MEEERESSSRNKERGRENDLKDVKLKLKPSPHSPNCRLEKHWTPKSDLKIRKMSKVYLHSACPLPGRFILSSIFLYDSSSLSIFSMRCCSLSFSSVRLCSRSWSDRFSFSIWLSWWWWWGWGWGWRWPSLMVALIELFSTELATEEVYTCEAVLYGLQAIILWD